MNQDGLAKIKVILATKLSVKNTNKGENFIALVIG